MKVDDPSFDKQELLDLLQNVYAIAATRLEFVPKGEESYSYIATTNTGCTYFVKVHQSSASPQLEACYRFVHQLRTLEGCEWVVSPYLTVEGKCLATLGNYAVVLFDYVVGITKLPSDLTASQQARFAGQLAKLHNSAAIASSNGVPKENFAISFRSWLMDVLAAVEQPLRTSHAWSQMAYDLIRTEKPQILGLLDQIDELATLLKKADAAQCVTHGDLASHNIIEDEHGHLLLFDWGKLCIAPAARDMVALWQEGNAPLLSAYFQQMGITSPSSKPVSKAALTYYCYYTCLAIITDYGSWLILEEASPEEAENAWTGLSQVLPFDLPKVKTKVEAIYGVSAQTA